MTAEDGLGDTLRPRLDAAGADPNRVFVLEGRRDSEGRVIPVTLADFDVFERAVARVKPALVVVDPIQGFLGADIDMHRANEVRPLLAGLARLAERFGFTALCIRHLRKSAADRSVHRGLGSIDFAAAARSILLVGEDPENDRRRVVAHLKSSLAQAGPSLAFEIVGGQFLWAGPSNLKAHDLLAPLNPDEVAPRREAEEFLVEELSGGPIKSKELERAAKEASIARRTLFRAKGRLGVKSKRIGGLGEQGEWWCSLPASATTPKSARVPSREVGTLSGQTSAQSVSGPPTGQVGTLSSWHQDPAVELEITGWGPSEWQSFEDHAARLEDGGIPRQEAETKAYALVAEERRKRRAV